ncbi:phage holin family protein [Enterococcus sp. LJL98]
MTFFQRILVNMLAFISLTVLFPEMIFVKSFTTALVASVVLSLLNTIIKPILMILSLPLTILTFGFFSFVINALMLQWTSTLVGHYNFGFASFGSAVFVAIILAFVNMIVNQRQLDKYMRR